jgi:hypothetical protein
MATSPNPTVRRVSRRRVQSEIAQREAQPYQPTPSDVFLASSMPLAAAGIYGRMGKGGVSAHVQVNAPASGPAQGNSVVTSDARGAQAAFPGHGQGNGSLADTGPANESPFGSVSGVQVRVVNTRREMLSAAYSYTDQFQHGRAIARDRHVIENQGRTTSGSGNFQNGGSPNPEKDGPPRPAWKMFNRSLSFQAGADSTRNLDNGQFHASTLAGMRKFPLATQGQEWSNVWGGTPGLANFRAYGKRGGFSAAAPAPTVRALAGGPYAYGRLLRVGDPGDGPQKVYGGLPWGLHSPTVPNQQIMKGVQANRFNQVKPVWNIRPQNSASAGQSWSQSMVSLTGQQAVKLGATPPIRQPGMNARWLGV